MIHNLFLGLITVLFSSHALAVERFIPNTVVTCTAHDCPPIPSILNSHEKLTNQAIIYQTSNQPEFMTRFSQEFTNATNGGWQKIIIDENEFVDTHPIIGFGGTFTDSAAMLYQHMQPALQRALINTYFSSQGIEYSLGRVSIGSNDFSCRRINNLNMPIPSLKDCSDIFSLYTYADKPGKRLNFSLQSEDLNFKIPMIHAANFVVNKNQGSLKLFASPWSAPAWMKTNGSMIHGSLNSFYQQIWADYFVEFLKAYQAHQIKFWGLTIQNEPVEDPNNKSWQVWQTMFFTPEQEADFIKDYLGPTLKKFEENYGSKVHIMIHDDQIISIKNRARMLDDRQVAQYVSGIGLHWYMNLNSFYPSLDVAYQTLNNKLLQPKRFILGTEACEGYLPMSKGPSFGSWSRGEAYGHDIISDLSHHVSGWTDWNLMLDMQGGPTWPKNYVDAPILVDLDEQVFYKQPMYYYLGHFSKFIKPGSKLLASQSNGPFALEEVTFKVPAYNNLPETIVVVVLNRSLFWKNYYIQNDSIPDENKYLNMYIPAHAIQTIIFKAHL